MESSNDGRTPRFRCRLPGLVIEVVSVAFAVLLALAVDEWREDRSNRQLGARAEASVLELGFDAAEEGEETRRVELES